MFLIHTSVHKFESTIIISSSGKKKREPRGRGRPVLRLNVSSLSLLTAVCVLYVMKVRCQHSVESNIYINIKTCNGRKVWSVKSLRDCAGTVDSDHLQSATLNYQRRREGGGGGGQK